MSSLGKEIRRIRKSRGETLVQVSEATGISASFLSGLERGQANPSLETLGRLASHFGVPANALLAGKAALNGSGHGSFDRPGFAEFADQMGDNLSESLYELLINLDNHARRPAQSKEDWLRYYYLVSSIVA